MRVLYWLWKSLTETKALEQSSGNLETAFFQSVYRVNYLAGLSIVDTNIRYLIYSYTVKCMIVSFVFSELWYLFSESLGLDGVVDSVSGTLIHLIGLYRYKNMIDHKETFKKLAAAMESPYFDVSTRSRRRLVEFWLKKNEKYLKLLFSLGTGTLAAAYLYPLLDDVKYNFAMGLRLPVEHRTPARYPIVYTVVLLAHNYTSFMVMVNDIIMQAHLMYLLCQFDVLRDCFENILRDCNVGFTDGNEVEINLNEESRQPFLKRLRDLVEQHKFILRHTLLLRKILSAPMLGQLATSSMIICFGSYQVIVSATISLTKLLMSLLYLGYSMFELFIICRCCDEIKIQSENIRGAVYCCGWERGVAVMPGVKARLILIVARASKPLTLTAGGLYDLSLMSYSTLVKTSYSAFTILLQRRQN